MNRAFFMVLLGNNAQIPVAIEIKPGQQFNFGCALGFEFPVDIEIFKNQNKAS